MRVAVGSMMEAGKIPEGGLPAAADKVRNRWFA